MKKLLTTLGVFTIVMASNAATFMRVKTANDNTVLYNVEDVIEVDFVDDTLHVPDYPYVDLGLPSGTLWAKCNVGATQSHEVGDYFAWGETSSKDMYSWNTYKHCIGKEDVYDLDFESLTKYNFGNNKGTIDTLDTLFPEDDAATVNLGEEWRIPTNEDFNELLNECYIVITFNYGYNHNQLGIIVYKAKNAEDKGKIIENGMTPSDEYNVAKDTHIYIPGGGIHLNSIEEDPGYWGNYWTSTLNKDDEALAKTLVFTEFSTETSITGRCYGLLVRPVRAKK